MIRLFVLLGLIGGTVTTYLATYGVGPEAQLPPVVSQLEKFKAEGYLPEVSDIQENPEAEHGIFEVPPMDEMMLEAALEAMGDMPGMDMGGGDGEAMEMQSAEGATMEMGDSSNGEAMEMDGTGMEMADTGGDAMEMQSAEGATMEMGDSGSGEAMEMDGAEGTAMDMGNSSSAEGMAMEMADTDGDAMEMAEGGLIFREGGKYDREIGLTMAEWTFSNLSIDVKAGEKIKLTVKNDGQIPHEFMLMTMPQMSAINYRGTRADWSLFEHEALFEEALVLPGGEISVVVQVQQAGVWMFMCMLPYHMQMGMMGQMATEGMAMDM